MGLDEEEGILFNHGIRTSTELPYILLKSYSVSPDAIFLSSGIIQPSHDGNGVIFINSSVILDVR